MSKTLQKKAFKYSDLENTADKDLSLLKTKNADFFEKKGEAGALRLFEYMRQNVPAYKKFLKDNGGMGAKTIEDFKKLPTITKDNYLRKYNYIDLFPSKNLFSATTISATSGSTGEPFYFPRNEEHDALYERTAEIFLKNQFGIDKKKTLGIIGFGLGIWIGGIFTYKNLNKLSQKGHNLTLIPVGANQDLYLKSFKQFAGYYDQVILMGYPPFIKDLLDAGEESGIKWKNYDIKILTAAEGYSENFRKYIAKKAGVKNIVSDIINIYGTVEQGTIAHETSFSNLIRKIASENKKVFKCLFPKAANIPTLAQYNPQAIYFEEVDGKIVSTAFGSAIPLVRYDFSDLGGVIKFDEMAEKLKSCGVDIFKEAKKWKIERQILHLPFVYVYSRSDFAVVFRGANIYPEEVRNGLDSNELNKFITGKATIVRKESKRLNQILEINVELKKGVSWNQKLKKKITGHIVKWLQKHNSEYAYLYSVEPNKIIPEVVGWPCHNTRFFSNNGKQIWLTKKKTT